MRPTFSIIAFTLLSGAGYGLLFLVGLGVAFGWSLLPSTGIAPDCCSFDARIPTIQTNDPRITAAAMLVTGAILTTLGLLASIGHLGKPLRAWRAFSQWRSSWLSREGVAALATYLPMLVLAGLLFCRSESHVAMRTCGALLALGCVVTVYCTAHIYSSLKPVRAWHNGFVLHVYFLLALYAGLLWIVAIALLPSSTNTSNAMQWAWLFNAMLIAPACAILKFAYWRWLDRPARQPDAGDATGLSRFGSVRSFERPHTEENYLTHEMGFVLARKHARRLRTVSLCAIAFAPIAMLPLAWLIGWPASWIVLVIGMLGILVERWLFFAEARHAVIAYYGG